jgi:hypothetical protein
VVEGDGWLSREPEYPQGRLGDEKVDESFASAEEFMQNRRSSSI